MKTAEVFADAFGRINEEVHAVVDGLDEETLAARPTPEANTIAWLIWHLVRVQDDHVSEVAGREQAWHDAGWAGRFGLPFDEAATGYGHSSKEVGQVRAGADLLLGYADAVHARTVAYVEGLVDDDLDRIVDERWDPPVSLGVRLVSVIGDDLQHAGQAAYARGVLTRAQG